MNQSEIIRELKTCVQVAANEGVISDDTHSALLNWLENRETSCSDDDDFDNRPEANCDEGYYE